MFSNWPEGQLIRLYTMMPGENHSKTAGIASEAVGSCQNCTSLQQNLNEYVAALITLKQKIMDSDHLLAEYQQKCDDLKDAERENTTLRCQLEQILHTISPCEQKEQLQKSLRVELEEKMSTVDVVQQSDLEIIREKKECKKCVMVKKKHNAKLKNMEEVASKYLKNVKQLQHEKRIIERELKKIQNKLGDLQKQKTMKNAQTQVVNDQPVVKLDKKKVRILLEELWGCIESSTENIECDTLQLETILRKENNSQNPDDYSTPPLDHFSSTLSCKFETFSESTVVYDDVNYSTQCKDSNEIHALKEYTEDKPIHTETTAKEDLKDSRLINSDHESDMEEVLHIMNWAKPLPHILSPLTVSPLTTKCVFGEITDSSDNEGSDESNKVNHCKTMENKITCIQNQTNISPCPETGNVNGKCKENVHHQYDGISIDTECIKSQSDPTIITNMETDKKNIEITPVQIEIHSGVANNALVTNGLTEQNPAEKNNLQSAINGATTLKEALAWYPNLNNPERQLSSFNNSELESLNPSSDDAIGKTTELEQPVGTVDFPGKLVIDNQHCSKEDASSSVKCSLPDDHNPSINASKMLCEEKSLGNNYNPDETCSSNEQESAISLQVHNISSAGENKVYDGINNTGENCVQNGKNDAGENRVQDTTNDAGETCVQNCKNDASENHVHNNINDTGENHVCENVILDKNIDNSNILNLDRCQDNLFLPTQPEMCLNEFNQKFNNKSMDFKETKEYKSCNEDVDTGKSDRITSVNVEMCSAAKIEQLSLELVEKSEISSSTPIVLYDHTRTISLYCTDKMDNVQEVSVQKSISLEQTLPLRGVAEDGDSYKAKPKKVGYSMQESLEPLPGSTEHAFQIHKGTTDQESDFSESFAGRHSVCLSMENLEDKSKGKMYSDLQCIANKTEKTKEDLKLVADESGSARKSHTVTELCEESLSEAVEMCSSEASLCRSVSLNAQKAVVTDVQPVIETKIDICSQNQAIAQLCSRHNLELSNISPNENNTFLSHFDTNNGDRCLNTLEGEHVLTEEGMTPLRNQLKMTVSMDLAVESRDRLDAMNKDHWETGTPKKQFQDELDSALKKTNLVCTLESNGDSPSINQPNSPLEEQHHLNVPSKSTKVINKITEKTYENSDTCAASLDSSDEDYFPVRKVNYTKAVSNKSMNLKDYCKSASQGIEEICNVHLESKDTLYKPLLTDVTKIEFTDNLSACGVPENDSSKAANNTPIEHNTSVTADIVVDLKNGKTASKNAVDQYLSEQEKVTATLEECGRQKEKLVSENIQYDHSTGQNCNALESDVKKMLPGKNLIWNFERPDDPINPRKPKSGKYKLRENANMLPGSSENPFSRTALNLEKRLKLNKVTKESHQQKIAQGEQSLQNILVGETVLANADTSTNSDHSTETITKVRAEMGPPLPPLLGPLLTTPPKSIQHRSPILSSSSCSSLPSPLDDFISPLPGTPFPQLVSPLSDGRRPKSPVHTTPPAESTNRRILSSPLQFCAATPKHALPVPGRLPLSASSSSSNSVQENSVKILDTMYPELSARARTLNILKGNVQLNRGLPRDGENVSVSQISGFKSITSTSTAFIKTGSNSKGDSSKDKSANCESQQQHSSIGSPSKRTADAFLMPRSAKRLRLDAESPFLETMKNCPATPEKNHTEVEKCQELFHNINCDHLPDVVKDSTIDEDIISKALKKIEDLCFDLVPVIRSHMFVGTIPKVPVMRNEEIEVIYEFSNSKKSLADRFLRVVLKKIKAGKRSMATTYLQALCRVYVGLCRQLGDIERARILGYSILKEDFPDPDRLLLFIVSSWNDIISTHGVVSKAIQAVLKNLAEEEVGSCLGAYLNWEKTPPVNTTLLLSSVLMAIQLCPDGKFQQSEKYGDDLTDIIWEYVFAVELLCIYRKWVWTHDKIISKELWPLLDKWVKRKKGNPNVPFVCDLVVATVLRLLGHLCQMGLKEGYAAAVKNIGAVILAFLQHANEEGMSWGVQLACVYMLFDVAPCDPATIYKTLQAWKEAAKNDIPPAVASCMQELESMCELAK